MLRQLLLGSVMLVLAAPAGADDTTAMAAYERIQGMRGQAFALLKPGAPSVEDLRKAQGILEAALAYWESVPVRERARGNVYLNGRRYDTLRDLAAVHAQLGERDRALDLLEEMQRESWLPVAAEWLTADAAFASLRGEPRFLALIATLTATARHYERPALTTPYQEQLPLEERIAGLALFWSQARDHFAYFDNVPDLDWDRTFLEFLPRVMAAENTRDYYRVLMQLAPLLRDGHTNIYAPDELSNAFYARPPIRTEWIDGDVVVTRVHSPSLAKRVRVGDVLIAIDGVPVQEYAEREVAPFVSASTPQDRRLRIYGYQLLQGDAERALVLTLRDARGRERQESVARMGYTDVVWPKQFEYRRLGGVVAYLSLDQFENDAGPKAFEAAWPKLRESRGLILDLRANGGGSTQHGFEVLSWLTERGIPQPRQWARVSDSLAVARGWNSIAWRPAFDADGTPFTRERSERYAGPVAVLIGPRTFSAAEDFVVAFDTIERGLLVGEATGGSTGQPLVFRLPGGGTARVCAKRDEYADDRRFVGVGVQPDIVVGRTLADVRAGRDPVLEQARVALLARAR